MPRLNRVMVEEICSKLSKLPDDGKPHWGKMNAPQVRGHLRTVVEYTLGAGKEMPFRGNWKSRVVFRPLILSGMVPIPKGIKVPRQKDGTEVPTPECTLEELRATLEKYVAAVEANGASHRIHPFFGSLSAREWQKFHVAHFKHHMTQFGVW